MTLRSLFFWSVVTREFYMDGSFLASAPSMGTMSLNEIEEEFDD